MGVNGLWRLVEPTGKPVPVETLENKVLAVDISIWLHQMVKGYQDAKGAPLPNAHLMGLFQRLCKLLYFRIKPVFVFDGAFPELKKETIAKRQDNKSRYQSESERLKRELALLLSKKTAVNSLLGKKVSPKKSTTSQPDDDIFKLPAMPEKKDETESESDDEDTSSGSIVDLHTIDLESENFKKMDVKEKYDLLVELKETRKMNSWGKLHEMPKKSDNFSDFQMQRLLKRRKVQECLQETEKEMGSSGMSLNELESLLNEEGIDTKLENMPTRHIASNNTTRFLLISDMKKAIEEAKNREIDKDKVVSEKNETSENKSISSCDLPGTSSDTNTTLPVKDELEEDLQKAIQMSLQNSDEPNTSFNTTNKTDESWSTFMTDSEYSYDSSDSDEKDGYEPPSMSSAKAYIMQYSDFTCRAIDEMVKTKSKVKKKNISKPKIDEILNEINKEKSIIKDHVNLSSDEDDCAVVNKTNNTSIIDVDALTCSESEINVSQDSSSVKSNNLHNRDEDNVCESKLKDTVIEDKCNSKLGQQFISVEKDDSVKNVENKVVSPINIDSDEDEELKKAIQMSLECVDEPPDVDKVNSESNSSDDDFEEVTDVNPVQQPVIQLSFDVNEAPEDDIFADVFTCTKNEEPPIFENVKNVIKQDVDIVEKTVQNEKTIQDDCKDNDEPKIFASSSKGNMEEVTLQTVVRNQIDLVDNSVKMDAINTVPQDEERDINNVPVLNENKTPALQSKDVTNEKPKTTEELAQLVQQMENKEDQIMQEKGRLDRVGRNITEQMTKEAQELLQIFGIPYIVAPMEAEAQCAFLENTKLTDGTITDDSDIWLFGGKTVYKNFFNQKKHVLQFISERIERSFNLPREQLILLAMLVGSDYTSGISGVGPVTALEILASFPYNKKTLSNETAQQSRYAHLVAGLQEFKKWVRSGKKTDNTSLKKKLRNVNVFDDFPSVRVVQAYMEPNIDKNESKFSWGEIDITVLRDYTKAKFGWSQHKLDEIVKPVLKRLQDRNSQKTIQDYFTRKVEFQNLEDQMSKRVKAAVQKMGPDQLLEEAALGPASTKIKKPRKRKTKVSEEKTENVDEIPSIVKKVAIAEPEINKEPIDIKIRKTDRYQEIIPQREKDKKSLLQNKMKAIEVFRKTKLDTKYQRKKKKPRLPKEKADLSESDSD